MFKSIILVLVLVPQYQCSFIDIDVETIITDEPNPYKHYHKLPHKTYIRQQKHDNYVDYEDVKYDLVEYDPNYKTINNDVNHFLYALRRLKPKKPRKVKPKKPIYRSAITIIANSAQKDIEHGTRKKLSNKVVPKMYMPVPVAQASSASEEHVPYGEVHSLGHSYNY